MSGSTGFGRNVDSVSWFEADCDLRDVAATVVAQLLASEPCATIESAARRRTQRVCRVCEDIRHAGIARREISLENFYGYVHSSPEGYGNQGRPSLSRTTEKYSQKKKPN
jgi:hypothetical protein